MRKDLNSLTFAAVQPPALMQEGLQEPLQEARTPSGRAER